MNLSPIALFVYNRPWHTQQTVEALKKNDLVEKSDLIVFSDGPKKESDISDVINVRNYLKTIKGFKSVNLNERERNIGLAESIIFGVTDVIDQYGRVIVLEDDLIVSKHFLDYMNTALNRYYNEERVMQISGHMFPVKIESREDAFFLPFITSWGWGTWKRAWDHFDPLMTGYRLLKNDRSLRRRFDVDDTFGFFEMLKLQHKGKIDSWAIRWYVSVFLLGGLALYPKESMVSNIGCDGSGAHSGSDRDYALSINESYSVVSFPEVLLNPEYYRKIARYFAGRNSIGSFVSKAISWAKRNILVRKRNCAL